MAIEIEAKMRVDDVDAMVARLQQRGAASVGRYLETNIFFDTEDRALLAADEGLRLRMSRDIDTGRVECTITHKGPHQYGPLKSREETEITVGEPETAVRLLERLGFVRVLTFQKQRHSWKLNACKVELDQMPCLGHFLEIEGPSEKAVMDLRDFLGLADRPLIKSTYAAMLTSYLQEHGDTRTEILFPSDTP